MSQYACLDELQTWLDSYLNFERLPQKNIFWLDTMEFLCKKMGDPQKSAPAFHVAGSKGKGSVSAMIASILDAAGCKTGLYSSPHILDFVERIGTAHGVFSEDVYQKAAEELRKTTAAIPEREFPGGRSLTWFELVTLYGFLCFRQAKTDYNVLEVGLGGRLDATNVIIPAVSCITPIELEHTEFLGDTLEKIAAEKGGIIKEGVPVVIAGQKPEVRTVFERIAAEKGAKVYFIDEMTEISADYADGCRLRGLDIDRDGEKSLKNNTSSDNFCNSIPPLVMQTTIRSPLFRRPICARLRLLGEFQAQNAALAATAVKLVLPDIDEKIIEKGLENAFLPGRFEIIANPMTCSADGSASCQKNASPARTASATRPFVILDGAHTVNSVKFTLETFRAVFGDTNTPGTTSGQHHFILLFACAADKDAKDIAPLFKDKFDAVFLTKPGNVKQSDLAALARAFDDAGLPYDLDEDFAAQIKKALAYASENNAYLLVTGSFYLLAEVKRILNLRGGTNAT